MWELFSLEKKKDFYFYFSFLQFLTNQNDLKEILAGVGWIFVIYIGLYKKKRTLPQLFDHR